MAAKKKRTGKPRKPSGEYYRVSEVAERLDCSEAHVRAMVGRGEIPGAVRYGPRMIRLGRKEVDEWIEERKQTGGR